MLFVVGWDHSFLTQLLLRYTVYKLSSKTCLLRVLQEPFLVSSIPFIFLLKSIWLLPSPFFKKNAHSNSPKILDWQSQWTLFNHHLSIISQSWAHALSLQRHFILQASAITHGTVMNFSLTSWAIPPQPSSTIKFLNVRFMLCYGPSSLVTLYSPSKWDHWTPSICK